MTAIVAVVLDLHQADHVGIDGHQFVDDLVALAHELGQVVGAAAVARGWCVAPMVQPWPVAPKTLLPLVKVVKKLSTLALATLTLPAGSSGPPVRGLLREMTPRPDGGCSL